MHVERSSLFEDNLFQRRPLTATFSVRNTIWAILACDMLLRFEVDYVRPIAFDLIDTRLVFNDQLQPELKQFLFLLV